MKVPLVDLRRQHQSISDALSVGWEEVLQGTQFVLGPQVGQFEEAFARYCEVGHCIGVANGTDALELGLRALRVGRGDKVVVPANSFIASALAVLRAGADVVLVDCDPGSHLIDVEQLADLLEPRVKAVMAVHLYGQAAAVEEIAAISGSVAVIEDAAQAHGAIRHGKRVGSLGVIAATSFYPSKNLGAYGDAGAVLTSDTELAHRVRQLGNWGSDRKYHHPIPGFNSRLDTLQAAVLLNKLARLEEWNRERATAAQRYHELLTGIDEVVRPSTMPGNTHVWHLYVIRVPKRDEVLTQMRAQGVDAGVHYPIPIHLQGAMSHLGHQPGDFPEAERAAAEVLSLPLFPGITEEEQEYVVTSLKTALRRVQARG